MLNIPLKVCVWYVVEQELFNKKASSNSAAQCVISDLKRLKIKKTNNRDLAENQDQVTKTNGAERKKIMKKNKKEIKIVKMKILILIIPMMIKMMMMIK